MSTQETTTTSAEELVADNIRGVRDSLSVKRVFGDSYEVDGVTIIPVARVAGGAGGGGGQGEGGTGADTAGVQNGATTGDADMEQEKSGSGFGTGFGFGARPLGVYEVRDGTVEWKPAIDVNRIVRGGQALAGVIAICVAALLWNRR